jgi:hypothetical protein
MSEPSSERDRLARETVDAAFTLPGLYRNRRIDAGFRMDIVADGLVVVEVKATEQILLCSTYAVTCPDRHFFARRSASVGRSFGVCARSLVTLFITAGLA